jgi:hypothetical protein
VSFSASPRWRHTKRNNEETSTDPKIAEISYRHFNPHHLEQIKLRQIWTHVRKQYNKT